MVKGTKTWADEKRATQKIDIEPEPGGKYYQSNNKLCITIIITFLNLTKFRLK
jgi:hypothetical protein